MSTTLRITPKTITAAARVRTKAAAVIEECNAREVALLAPFGLAHLVGTLDGPTLRAVTRMQVEGEHWISTGPMRNAKTLPVVRRSWKGPDGKFRSTDWSLPRVLHDVISADHDPPDNMRSSCGDKRCVRPLHRCDECRWQTVTSSVTGRQPDRGGFAP